MITTTDLWITLFISLIFIISGVYFKKKFYLFSIFGGVLLLIMGLLTFTNPISIISYDNNYIYGNNFSNDHWNNSSLPEADNITYLFNIQENIIYTPINYYINLVLSWVFLLIGISSIIGVSIKVYDTKYEEKEDEIIKFE